MSVINDIEGTAATAFTLANEERLRKENEKKQREEAALAAKAIKEEPVSEVPKTDAAAHPAQEIERMRQEQQDREYDVGIVAGKLYEIAENLPMLAKNAGETGKMTMLLSMETAYERDVAHVPDKKHFFSHHDEKMTIDEKIERAKDKGLQVKLHNPFTSIYAQHFIELDECRQLFDSCNAQKVGIKLETNRYARGFITLTFNNDTNTHTYQQAVIEAAKGEWNRSYFWDIYNRLPEEMRTEEKTKFFVDNMEKTAANLVAKGGAITWQQAYNELAAASDLFLKDGGFKSAVLNAAVKKDWRITPRELNKIASKF